METRWADEVPERGNCWSWAREMQRRYGGYLVFRRSHFGFWYHVLWMPPDRSVILSYSPINPINPLSWQSIRTYRWRAIPWDLLWFRGRVVIGDTYLRSATAGSSHR